jgi:cell division septation protein DedD
MTTLTHQYTITLSRFHIQGNVWSVVAYLTTAIDYGSSTSRITVICGFIKVNAWKLYIRESGSAQDTPMSGKSQTCSKMPMSRLPSRATVQLHNSKNHPPQPHPTPPHTTRAAYTHCHATPANKRTWDRPIAASNSGIKNIYVTLTTMTHSRRTHNISSTADINMGR